MQFINTPQMSGFILLVFFCASVLTHPVTSQTLSVKNITLSTGNVTTSHLETRQYGPRDPNDPNKRLDFLTFWGQTDFKPATEYVQQGEDYGVEGQGACINMIPNWARSARAQEGYKCTIYSDKGCHGWRTREFNHKDGITDMGPKMNGNGAAWRCCRINKTNAWGWCDAKLNDGTPWYWVGTMEVQYRNGDVLFPLMILTCVICSDPDLKDGSRPAIFWYLSWTDILSYIPTMIKALSFNQATLCVVFGIHTSHSLTRWV